MPTPVERAEELFLAALELPVAERARFLDAECGGDRVLRDEVAELLSLDGAADGLSRMDEPAVPPERIGPYELRERLGEGGMGIVYRAEQREPLRRTVALKVMKPGIDSREFVARFEAERQALVLMDHPHIAKVHDAGTTEDGRPYFAMELIEGVRITDYCDVTELSVQDRIRLFLPVCRAVQHAHQNGVIHRDLKPSNVLVAMRDSQPVPVVIDFGIAKALGGSLTEQTLHTAHHQVLGTLEYMSPEQAEMAPLGIDTRSDVYSLGVLLYELLAGVTPIDSRALRRAALMEAQRMICDTEPPRPSTRISTLGADAAEIARHRRADPRALRQHLRGDIDWIAMRCLEKDPLRRYQSANDLALDLERHLRHEPVAAGPPGMGYRLKKLVRRHRVATAVTAAIALGVVLAIAGVLLEQQRTKRLLAQLQGVDRAAKLRDVQDATDAGRAPALRKEVLEDPDDFPPEHQDFTWRWLHARSTLPEPLRIDLPRPASQLAFHPGGEHVLLVGVDSVPNMLNRPTPVSGKAQLWSLRAGVRTPEWELPGETYAACFLDGGRRVVTADAQTGELLVWDPAESVDQPIAQAAGGRGQVLELCVARSGAIAAVVQQDRRYRVRIHDWDGHALSAREPFEFAAQEPRIRGIALDAAGRRLLVGDATGSARVLDATTGAPLSAPDYGGLGESLHGVALRDESLRAVSAVAFSPDGQRVAVAGDNRGRVGLYRAADGDVVHVLESSAGTDPQLSHDVAFGPDGRYLASCGNQASVRLFSVETGRTLAALPIASEPNAQSDAQAVAIGPHGRRLCVATGLSERNLSTRKGVLTVWDLGELPLPVELIGHRLEVRGLLVTEDGRHAFTHDEESVYKWRLATGEALFVYRDSWLAPECTALRPVLGASGRPELAVGGQSGRGVVLDAETAEKLREFELPANINRTSLEFENLGILSLAYSPDGATLAIGPGTPWIGGDPNAVCPVVLLDADELRETRRLSGFPSGVAPLHITRDGAVIGRSHYHGDIRCWDLASGEPEPLATSGWWTALDPAKNRLFVLKGSHRIALLDPRSGEDLGTWIVSEGGLTDVDVHPSGRELLLTTPLRTTIWDDPPRNRLCAPLPDRSIAPVARARFAGDSGLVASAGSAVTYYPQLPDPAGFAARRTAWRAARIVDALFERPSAHHGRREALGLPLRPDRTRTPMVDEVRERIRADKGLDPEVRAAALARLSNATEDPWSLAITAWTMASSAVESDRATLERARGYAEIAARWARSERPGTFQESIHHSVLGVICCRLGEHGAAVPALQIGARGHQRLPAARCRWGADVFAAGGATTSNVYLALIRHEQGDREAALAELENAWTIGIVGPIDEKLVGLVIDTLGLRVPTAKDAPPGSPIKAAGPADASRGGRSANAWFPAREATLTLEYERAVPLTALRVFEVGRPGALMKISALDASGLEHPVHPGEHTTRDGDTFRYAGPAIETQRIRVVLDPSRADGSSGIDTVRLIGPDSKQWPVKASER